MLDLKARRKELGLTLKEVAEAVGVSESCISRYENGSIRNMGANLVERYAAVLCVDPIELVRSGSGLMNPESDPYLRQIIHELRYASPEMKEDALAYIRYQKQRRKL